MKRYFVIVLWLVCAAAFAAELPLSEGIPRFKANEDRVDRFVNTFVPYTTNTGTPASVESLPAFMVRKETEINSYAVAANGDTLVENEAELISADAAGSVTSIVLLQSFSMSTTIVLTKPLRIKAGAVITTTGHTLTINSSFSAPDVQVFAGTGAVTGLSIAKSVWFPATQAGLQLALNSADFVELSGDYTITGTGLDLNDGQKITGLNSPTLTSADSYIMSVNRGTGGSSDPADNKKNILIKGINFVHTGAFSESTHQLNLNAISDAVIEDNTFTGFKGDAIYLGSSNSAATERHNERVTIRRNVFDGNGKENRNAVSVIDGTDIVIKENYFTDCGKSTMPGAIDIEPNTGNAFSRIRNITIENNHLYDIGGNVGAIAAILPDQAGLTAPVEGIKILNNVIDTNTANISAIYMRSGAAATETTIPQGIVVAGNVIKNAGRFLGMDGLSGTIIENNYFDTSVGPGLLGSLYANYNTIVSKNKFIRGATDSGGGALIVYDADFITFSYNLFDDNGLSVGGYGNAIDFHTGTSTHVKFIANDFTASTGLTTVAIQKEAGHTFTPLNNVFFHNYIESGLGNSFVAWQTDLVALSTLTVNDTTPSVGSGKNWQTNNSNPTTITTFDDMADGQEITVVFGDANTTIAETDNIHLSAAFTSTQGDVMEFIKTGGQIYEKNRSVN